MYDFLEIFLECWFFCSIRMSVFVHQFWKCFAGYRSLGWKLLSFRTSNLHSMLCPCLIISSLSLPSFFAFCLITLHGSAAWCLISCPLVPLDLLWGSWKSEVILLPCFCHFHMDGGSTAKGWGQIKRLCYSIKISVVRFCFPLMWSLVYLSRIVYHFSLPLK